MKREPSKPYYVRVPVSCAPAVEAAAVERGFANVPKLARHLLLEAAGTPEPYAPLVAELARLRSALVDAMAHDESLRPAILQIARVVAAIEKRA